MARRYFLSLCLLACSGQCNADVTLPGVEASTVRAYVVVNYRRLALNIADGNGIYLDALEQMIVPECRISAASRVLADLLVQQPDQVRFAIAVAERCAPAAASPVPEAA